VCYIFGVVYADLEVRMRSTQISYKLVVDDYAADVVSKIFNLYADGLGKIRIAHILNEAGVLSIRTML